MFFVFVFNFFLILILTLNLFYFSSCLQGWVIENENFFLIIQNHHCRSESKPPKRGNKVRMKEWKPNQPSLVSFSVNLHTGTRLQWEKRDPCVAIYSKSWNVLKVVQATISVTFAMDVTSSTASPQLPSCSTIWRIFRAFSRIKWIYLRGRGRFADRGWAYRSRRDATSWRECT